ncbi:MAG: L-glutamate gamma-semialdehyde dehydrogenase [Herpetosiphon sp.]
MLQPFQNEPLTSFSNDLARQTMFDALAAVREQLGQRYDLVINGQAITTDETFVSINPGKPQQVIGSVAKATPSQAKAAIEAASTAFASWRQVSPQERAGYLFQAAARMRRDKLRWAAWLVYEVSKTWGEADADVAEAIDFMEYYGREMLRLNDTAAVVTMAGEDNSLQYIPLGVGVVIPPWNFPLAIMAGMTTAAIVAGNTVVLKPASTSPVIAALFVRLLNDECRLPHGVLNFVPGSGSAVGDVLVDHPLTRFIAFTGSKEIGLRIFERAAVRQPGQQWLKRTILEMGGKDALVVDETADLDLAAEAITASAFGFQGQKCSACSRAIVVSDVYDDVLARVVERTRRLKVGDTTDPTTNMGAVIDHHAWEKIRSYIEVGRTEGRVSLGGEVGHPDQGFFIPPTIVSDLAPDSRVACEEIFGPVLAFVRARHFDHAVEIFNATEYGLTGGLISRDRSRLQRARNEFHVGNLYLNRKITGAFVGAQPFGGFNMSGTDSKAGGPDYLLLFTQAKSITERY